MFFQVEYRFVLFFVVILFFSLPCLAVGKKGEVPEVTIIEVKNTPSIDGKLDDPAWIEVARSFSGVLSGWKTLDGKRLIANQRIAYLTYDEKHLFVASVAFVDDPKSLEKNSWRSDGIEIHLEIGSTYYQLGVFYDGETAIGAGHSINFEAAGNAGTNYWSVEVAIPWDELGLRPKEGMEIGFNIAGHDYKDKWVTWGPSYGKFRASETLSFLKLGGKVEENGQSPKVATSSMETSPLQTGETQLPEDDAYIKKTYLFKQVSFNLLDPSKVNFTKRYSIGSMSLIEDKLGIAASDWIPVEEGELYTVSGNGPFGQGGGPQGGYFSAPGETRALANISFFKPVDGPGWVFQVPRGLGITQAIISLRKLNDDPAQKTLHGLVQLELGEKATDFQPYNPQTRIKQEFLPQLRSGESSSSVSFNSEAWYKFTEGDGGQQLADKIPNFRRHWLKKDQDLVIVNTGTSLTARSAEHCTLHPEAKSRPPLMHSNNMASILWDKIKWDGQEYRRYDADGFFREGKGLFLTASNLPQWDDGPYRQGLTRYSDTTGASVSFEVPSGAWQFNFIYRTDTTGCSDPIITIEEGDGQLEVYHEETGIWVEANRYQFSMYEEMPVSRTVRVPKAADGTYAELNIPSKGNTTYQKRLKMRSKSDKIDSRSVSKQITISGQSPGRFMYWGVEWSPREFMITYINAARGSHNSQAENERGLPRFADNEVWGFKPDLLFFELPIHNDGAANANPYPGGYWERLTDNFVFNPDYELSMRSRASHFGLNPEIGMFTSSISWNFGGINEDGSLKIIEQKDGKMMSALDKYNEAYNWVIDNHPDVVIINAAKRWYDAAVAIFGDLKAATVGSGKGGLTFTNEGSHWNDTGSKIIAKAILAVFDFIR